MAVKCINILPSEVCDPDFIEKIVSWDQVEVEKFLAKNGICGCRMALAANAVDGKAFLTLNNQMLASWGIPIIKRSKIIALLNDLGSESSRKGAVLKTHVRPGNAVLCINITKSPTTASPCLTTFSSPKPEVPKTPSLPVIPPKPKHLQRKPISIRNLSEDETQKVEKIHDRYAQLRTNDNMAAECEPKYIYHENADIYAEVDEQSITRTINEVPRVASDIIPDRRTPSREVSTGYTNGSSSDDDRDTSTASASVLDGRISPPNNRMRKNDIFTNWWFNLKEEQLPQGNPCGTPPLPPARNQNTSRCSSESNLSQSGSESVFSSEPTSRKQSMQSVTSLSSLAESLPSPGYAPRPAPTPPRRITPVRRPTPGQGDPSMLPFSPFFGSQIILPPNPRSPSPPVPPPTSPEEGTRSSNISTDSEMTNYPWFFSVDRKQAESLLRPLANGTFLIRPSKHAGANVSFTLSVQYNNRVFHVPIRSRTDGKMALGSEKIDENSFDTLHELVELHYLEALQLHSGDGRAGTTRLSRWPTNIT